MLAFETSMGRISGSFAPNPLEASLPPRSPNHRAGSPSKRRVRALLLSLLLPLLLSLHGGMKVV